MTRSDFRHLLETPPDRRGTDYWKSLEELAGEADFDAVLQEEWPRLAAAMPGMDRRSFMKLVMANMAVLGVGASDALADEEAVGYVTRPETAVPGVPAHYASAISLSGYANGILGETHDGRPTRIQGHPDDPVSRGASTAIQQATIYDLYDPDRLRAVRQARKTASWDIFLGQLSQLRQSWQAQEGAGLHLLTGQLTSPSQLAQIGDLRRAFPAMRWYAWEAVDRSAVAEGSRLAFGERLDTHYHLRRARRILTLDADFLSAEEPDHLRCARDFAEARRPDEQAGQPPARLYAIESTPTLAGAKADHRLPLRHSLVERLARVIASRLGVEVEAPSLPEGVEEAWVDALVADLQEHRGESLVIPGFHQPASLHALAHAMNAALDNTGGTLTYHAPVTQEPDGTLGELAQAMDQGEAGTLVILGGNPVHDAPADLDFRNRLQKLGTSIYWGVQDNETAAVADWVIPAAHELEAWGDVRAFEGTSYLQQPLIRPLHGGHSALEFLAALGGDYASSGREILRRRLVERRPDLSDDTAWRRLVQGGILPETASPQREPALRQDWAADLPESSADEGNLELQFRPHPAIWDGRFANNGWLQELPEPLSKLVWGNAAWISPALARERGLGKGDIVRLTLAERSLEVPVWPMPGQPEGAVTLHLGFGRDNAGQLGTGVGRNAYRLRESGALWTAGSLELEATGASEELATTQHHHDIEGRDLLRAAEWSEFRENPRFAKRHAEEELTSLYSEPTPRQGQEGEVRRQAWGMVIDHDICTGCSACITACQAENNIPIVGKEEVRRGREMHWLRIDRYYAGAPENPKVSHQPIPCMHCENAPCEYVCPVEATQHSSDGLNEMIYNRCIGTRYCSQNCPYKVRRFNWFDYTGPDTELPFLEAAQNPDVTVRSRGVMEKCTYCVQRINRTRIAAEREGREIEDGEVVTACQEACPSNAIVFGDLSDPESEVARHKENPRNYGLLEELNTRPRTTYLAEVRDPNPALHRDSSEGSGS